MKLKHIKGWKTTRDKIVKRANGHCEDCGKESKDLSIHHILSRNSRRKEINKEADWNLIALCRKCHWYFGLDNLATMGILYNKVIRL